MTGTLRGAYRCLKYKKGADEPYAIEEAHNTIQTAGKDLYLDLMRGTSSAHFSAANADIEIYDSGSTLVKTITGADALDHGTVGQVTWTWEDNTTDSYEAYQIIFSNGTTDFSDATPNFGTKPTDENWHYEYTLSISGDAALVTAGLDHTLRLFTGNASTHFDGTNNTTLEVRDSGNVLVGTATPDSAPTRSGQTLEWVYTVSAGSMEDEWFTIIIDNVGAGDELRNADDNLGTKQTNSEWTYTYQFSLS